MVDTTIDQKLVKTRVAAAIVAKNDDTRLEGTIKSVITLVDHVFVLNLNSSDLTAEVAALHGATVFNANWNHDYSAAKNLLLEKIENIGLENGEIEGEKFDFVLWINPGELFDFRTAPIFREFLANEIDPNSAYILIERRYAVNLGQGIIQLAGSFLEDGLPGGPASLYPVDGFSDWNEETISLRLMPTRKNLSFSGRLRENIIPSLNVTDIQLSAAPGRILDILPVCDPVRNTERSRDVFAVINKIEESGLGLTEDELLAKADALVVLSDVIGAREIYKNLTDNSLQRNVKLEAYYKLDATYNIVPPVGNERIELLLKALETFPFDMQLLTFLGLELYKQRNMEVAIRTLSTAIEHGQISLDVWHRECINEIAIAHLSLIYRLTGAQSEAIELLENTITDLPTHAQLARLLFDLYIAKRDEEKLHAFAAHYWGDADLDMIRNVFTGACRANAGAWTAALVSLENAYNSSIANNGKCKDVFCLRWYSLALLSNLRFEDACKILDQWLELEPANIEARSFRYAAAHPFRFNEIMDQLQRQQAFMLGVDPSENFDNLVLPEKSALPEENATLTDTNQNFPEKEKNYPDGCNILSEVGKIENISDVDSAESVPQPLNPMVFDGQKQQFDFGMFEFQPPTTLGSTEIKFGQ
ncbi:MAG: tetratricopeptide repeat-containing glycosyltransferase [Thermoguttaceae bacterium]